MIKIDIKKSKRQIFEDGRSRIVHNVKGIEEVRKIYSIWYTNISYFWQNYAYQGFIKYVLLHSYPHVFIDQTGYCHSFLAMSPKF
jgi:hypothetical protein